MPNYISAFGTATGVSAGVASEYTPQPAPNLVCSIFLDNFSRVTDTNEGIGGPADTGQTWMTVATNCYCDGANGLWVINGSLGYNIAFAGVDWDLTYSNWLIGFSNMKVGTTLTGSERIVLYIGRVVEIQITETQIYLGSGIDSAVTNHGLDLDNYQKFSIHAWSDGPGSPVNIRWNVGSGANGPESLEPFLSVATGPDADAAGVDIAMYGSLTSLNSLLISSVYLEAACGTGQQVCGITDSFSRSEGPRTESYFDNNGGAGLGNSDAGIPWVSYMGGDPYNDPGDTVEIDGSTMHIHSDGEGYEDATFGSDLVFEHTGNFSVRIKFKINPVPSLTDWWYISFAMGTSTDSSNWGRYLQLGTSAGSDQSVVEWDIWHALGQNVPARVAFTPQSDTWYQLLWEAEEGVEQRAKWWAVGDTEPVSWMIVDSLVGVGSLNPYGFGIYQHAYNNQSYSWGPIDWYYDDLDIEGINACTQIPN